MKIQILFFILLPWMASSQDGIPYLDFTLRISGAAIDVEWSVQAGNICQDVEIWRGTDSLNLEQVYVYAGICGDDDSVKFYNYIDQPSVSGIRYYYRIVVITDRTELKSVVSYPQNKTEVFPNPAHDFVKVIRDPQKKYLRYLFYDLQGRERLSIKDPEVTEQIDLRSFIPGYYLLKLEDNSEDSQQLLKIE